jgi:hypothetical protein
MGLLGCQPLNATATVCFVVLQCFLRWRKEPPQVCGEPRRGVVFQETKTTNQAAPMLSVGSTSNSLRKTNIQGDVKKSVYEAECSAAAKAISYLERIMSLEVVDLNCHSLVISRLLLSSDQLEVFNNRIYIYGCHDFINIGYYLQNHTRNHFKYKK